VNMLCIVLKCVEFFVLFNFLSCYMYGDMFHLTLMGNDFMKVGDWFCNY
jgi:hypothetical protein